MLDKKEIVLRICDPPTECRVVIQNIPKGICDIKVTLFVGQDSSKTQTLSLQSTDDEETQVTVDDVCAVEAVQQIETSATAEVAAALSVDEFDKASQVNALAATAIRDLFSSISPSPEVIESVAAVLRDLELQSQDIERGIESHAAAKELELRVMSRSSTDRNGGVSLDPTSRTLSELQSQLSQS